MFESVFVCCEWCFVKTLFRGPPLSRMLQVLSRRALVSSVLVSVTTATDLERRTRARIKLPPLEQGFTRLYLCRHGETNFNVESRVQGSTDNPLNPTGLRQAAALGEFLQNEPIDVVASSNLIRARSTADAVASWHPKARRSQDVRLAEMCFGSFEGRTIEDVKSEYDAFVREWKDGNNDKVLPGPGGESPK